MPMVDDYQIPHLILLFLNVTSSLVLFHALCLHAAGPRVLSQHSLSDSVYLTLGLSIKKVIQSLCLCLVSFNHLICIEHMLRCRISEVNDLTHTLEYTTTLCWTALGHQISSRVSCWGLL